MAVTGSPRDNQRPESEAGLRRMKTWFITGTSRGFGREWTIAALDRGDQVAATARNLGTLDDLVTKYGDSAEPRLTPSRRPGAMDDLPDDATPDRWHYRPVGDLRLVSAYSVRQYS
jgi:NAD(P)-dependent dehydrogenase (short-subunit alcohol dehydrogenase family)